MARLASRKPASLEVLSTSLVLRARPSGLWQPMHFWERIGVQTCSAKNSSVETQALSSPEPQPE
jgi:hypothetical protein